MNNNPHNDQGYTDAECLTEQQMLDYNSNKLTPHERHMVEKHTLDCEMCADALEGFALIKDHSKLDDTVIAVNAMVTGQPVAPVKRAWWDARMKVAASVAILVLLGSVYYFQATIKDKAENAFAHNFEAYPAPQVTEKPAASIEPSVTDEQAKETAPGEEANNNDYRKNESTGKLIVGLTDAKSSEEQLNTYSYNASGSQAPKAASPNGLEMDALSAEETVMQDFEKAEESKVVAIAENNDDKKDAASLNKLSAVSDNNGSNSGTTVATGNKYDAASGDSPVPASTGAATYTWKNESSGTTLTPSEPAQQQSLVSKQEPYTVKRNKSATDNLFALENLTKKKTRSKNAPAESRSEMEKESETKAAGKDKAAEKPSKEQPAAYEGSGEAVSYTLKENNTMDSVSLATPFSKAMKQYQAGRHSEALPLFEQALAAEPSHVDALFYSAVSYLAMNKPDKALVNLDKVLAAKNHSFGEPAKWYKALAYLKKGDKKTAKTLLQQIEKENGSYRQKATEALKDLD